MSGSMHDDRDVSTVPADQFVPHHYLMIPAVVALPAGDRRERSVIAEWLRHNNPSRALLDSLQRAGYGDLLRSAS